MLLNIERRFLPFPSIFVANKDGYYTSPVIDEDSPLTAVKEN